MSRDLEMDTPKTSNVTLGALRAAFSRVPLWTFTWGVVFLLSLPVALVWWQGLGSLVGNHYAPGAQLAWWTADFRVDHGDELGRLREQSRVSFALLAVVAQLLGVFFAGGWLQVFLVRTSGHSLRRFLWGGARTFWRFLRLWLVVLGILLVTGWLLLGDPWTDWFAARFGADTPEELAREDHAFWWGVLPSALFAIVYAKVHVWATYTRARLALLNSRSVFVAGSATFWMLVRHPFRTWRPMIALFLLNVAVVAILGFVSRDVDADLGPNSGWKTILVLFALGQVALLVRSALMGARYAAAVAVCRSLVRMADEPDPFADRVGGPGGPQYPIDDSDEYGVSY